MHVAHITSHFASLDYSEVIRGRAIRFLFAARLSHRCNRSCSDRSCDYRGHREEKAASMAIIDAARR
jgi:hypothetical protein